MKKKTDDTFRGAGKVAFLARQTSIKKMVDEGYPLTVIYKKYGKELNISYGQFTRYVNKHIRSRLDEENDPESSARSQETIATDTKPPTTENEDKSTEKNKGGKAFKDDSADRAKNDEDLF